MELTDKEKKEIEALNNNIKSRKLVIQIESWKKAYEKLSTWIKKNFNDTSLYEVEKIIKDFRPEKEKK